MGTQAQSPPLPSFQDAVISGARTQQPSEPTGPVDLPPSHSGNWPTTATEWVAVAGAGASRPPSCSSSGSPSPSPHLPAPFGSGSAPFTKPRRGCLQPPLSPGNQPAPPRRPPYPPWHRPWPAVAQTYPPRPASSWSPASPLMPGLCLPQRPVAPSPTAPVLTLAFSGALPAPAASLPACSPCSLLSILCLTSSSTPWSLSRRGASLAPGLRLAASALPVGVQGFQARPGLPWCRHPGPGSEVLPLLPPFPLPTPWLFSGLSPFLWPSRLQGTWGREGEP